MKRLLITVLFLLITTGAGAEFFGSGEFGYNLEPGDFYVALEFGYMQPIWWFELGVYGGLESTIRRGRDGQFKYYNRDYYMGGKIRRDWFFINVERHCLYPVVHVYFYDGIPFMNEGLLPNNLTKFGIGFEF